MRRLLPLLPALALLAQPGLVHAQGATPAVDLVAKFVLGAAPGATVAIIGDSVVSTVTQTGPGGFELAPDGQPKFAFQITDKGGCIFDIVFSQGGQPGGGIEIDANKLKSVTYDKRAENDKFVSYAITLVGGENVVQWLVGDGTLAPVDPSSSLSSSVSTDDMQAAVAEFQSAYCKAAA